MGIYKNKTYVTKCLNLRGQGSFSLSQPRRLRLFLVYLCPSNKPQGTVSVNLSSGPWSLLQSLLQWLQSVIVKGGIDGDIISF